MELRAAALEALSISEPAAKVAATRALFEARAGLAIDTTAELHPRAPLPGRPERPPLVEPKDVPRRTPFTREGRAALLHAVAHIEFNAIKTIYKEVQL